MPGWRIIAAMRITVTVFLTVFLAFQPVVADWHREEAAIMGTAVAVELWSADADEGRALARTVLDEMRRIDRLMSSYRPDSELSRVNAAAAEHPVRVSDELMQLLKRALEYSVITDGAFDITYASAIGDDGIFECPF